MRPRPFVVGAVLVLALVGASLGLRNETAGPASEQAIEAELDKLHQVRPTAAAISPRTTSPAPIAVAGAFGSDPALLEPSLVVPALPAPPPPPAAPLADAAVPAEAPPALVIPAPVAPRAVPAAEEAVPAEPPAPSPPAESSESAAATLACIRNRESRGDYTVVSANGLYYGAYQFLRST